MPMEFDPGEGLHYLDNASTLFPKPPEMLEEMLRFSMTACVNPGRTTFDLALVAEQRLLDCRRRLCRLVNGPAPERVVFGYNATDALNLVIFGLLRDGGHVVTTNLEHNSVLRPIAHCVDDHGARVTIVPCDSNGFVDSDDIARAVQPDTRLVVVTHASNVIGTIQPVAEIGEVCRRAGVPLCVDAAQSAGLVPIDMAAMNIDAVAFTGHKALMGPTGIGGLCVGTELVLPHTRAGGTGVKSVARRHLEDYPYRLEYGTPNTMGIAGLAAGLELLEQRGGPAAVLAEEMVLTELLAEGLRAIDGVTLYCGATLEHHTPVLLFNIDGIDPGQVGARLDVDYSVACRTGLHCAPLVHEFLGTAPDGAVRFSLGPHTNRADVEAGVSAVRNLVAESR